MAAVIKPIQPSHTKPWSLPPSACTKMTSFDSIPAENGNAESHRQPINMVHETILNPGTLRRPDSLRRSSCPAKPCMMAPAVRNNNALKKACVSV